MVSSNHLVVLNPSHFSARKPAIVMHIMNRPEPDLNREIGLMSVDTFVPLVVVGFFVGETLGFTEEIVAKIRRDMVYHGVDEVVGLEDAIQQYKISLSLNKEKVDNTE